MPISKHTTPDTISQLEYSSRGFIALTVIIATYLKFIQSPPVVAPPSLVA
jgi:hypothetical protein